MEQKQEKVFAKGIYAEKPNDKAPKWILANVSVKVPDFIPFLNLHQNNAGYVNITLKESESGKIYFELNTFKPSKDTAKEELSNQDKLNGLSNEYKEPLIDPVTNQDLSGDSPF